MTDERAAGNAGAGLRAEWEARYREADALWSGKPNAVLARHIDELVPVGRGIDLGCGEGADAIYLARHGWEMTGLDIAATALERAAGHAQAAGVEVTWGQADLQTWVPEQTYDLVTAFFVHSRGEFRRDAILRAAANAVAPGGLLLIAGHWSVPSWSAIAHANHAHDHGHGGHDAPEFDSVEDTIAQAGVGGDDWDLLVAGEEGRVVERVNDAGETETDEIFDVVVLARRR